MTASKLSDAEIESVRSDIAAADRNNLPGWDRSISGRRFIATIDELRTTPAAWDREKLTRKIYDAFDWDEGDDALRVIDSILAEAFPAQRPVDVSVVSVSRTMDEVDATTPAWEWLQDLMRAVPHDDHYSVRIDDRIDRDFKACSLWVDNKLRAFYVQYRDISNFSVVVRCDLQQALSPTPSPRPAESPDLATLASAFRKFAPDLAAELAERWISARDREDAALDHLLAFLRGHSGTPIAPTPRPADTAPATDGWPDIASAPKDRTRVLVSCGLIVEIGHFTCAEHNHILLSAWHGDDGKLLKYRPTNWQPLPPPPATGAEGK